jgi:hypothetical protein
MSNFSRYNLVTKFVCANCGKFLCLSYEAPDLGDYEQDSGTRDNITGADKVENRIAIEPCKTCYSKAREPIEHLRAALKGAEQ